MKKYTIGLITGALLAVSAMMFMGSQNKNLGDITVNSITVKGDNNGGWIKTFNADGKETVYLGEGYLETFNNDGIITSYLGTGEDGNGHLETFNKDEIRTGYFGTVGPGFGDAILFDTYGDIDWSARGKQ
tara:strand:- start:47 stop:436 length:390 start_codon:yes stop_codon:yes gene_type:complete